MKTDRRRFLSATLGSGALLALSSGARASKSDAVSPAVLAADPLRPQYHLLPPANWTNDPNGPIYWNGKYHMFYQYNPNGAYWGDMHWGHAVSPDMVHWRHLPVALAPTPGGPDADGCFSGTAVVQDGRVVLLYTGVRAATEDVATIKGQYPMMRETQCLAVSTDPDLLTWEKSAAPVISSPPPDFEVNGFRDPSPWRQGDWWYTVLASGVANQGGAVLLYRSRDLRQWEYVHILSGAVRTGPDRFASYNPWDVWECPEFFALGDWHVLIFSTGGRVFWQSGKLDSDSMSFHPQQSGILDYGTFYAAKTQLDRAGNRILWGWINETRPLAEYKAAGWAGMLSLPRVLTVTNEGQLRFRVADEVNQLRSRDRKLNFSTDEAESRKQLAAVRIAGCCGEVLCRIRRTEEAFALYLRGSHPNHLPWLTMTYDPRHSSRLNVDARPLPLDLDPNEDLEIHFYVDGSVIELFLNGRIAFVKRFYYEGRDAQDLCLEWEGPVANLAGMSIYELTPISRDRLTT